MQSSTKTFLGWGCVLALAAILLGSWVPLHLQTRSMDEVWDLFLTSLSVPGFSRGDTVANVLIGIPLGFLLTGYLAVGRNLGGLLCIVVTLTTCVAVITQGMVCELGQGWVSDRVTSARDVIAQSIGGVIGVSAWWLTGRHVERAIERMFAGQRLWMRVETAITVAAIAVLIWSVMPFDVLVSPAELAKKWSRGGIEWVPFTFANGMRFEWIYQWTISTLIAVPLGLWVGCSILPRVTRRNASTDLVLAAIIAGVLPEVLQIPIAGRIASATDALFGIIGAGAGIWISQTIWPVYDRPSVDGKARLLTRPSTWLIAALGYWVALCLVSWFPFNFITEPEAIRDLFQAVWQSPFSDYRGSNLRSLFVFFRQAVMSAIFGALLGVGIAFLDSTFLRRSMMVLGIAAIMVLSVLLELGQLLERSHSGAGLGLVVRIVGSLWGGLIAYWVIRGTYRRNVTAGE